MDVAVVSCSQHLGEQIQNYCATCGVLLCLQCLKGAHGPHHVIEYRQYLKGREQHAKELLHRLNRLRCRSGHFVSHLESHKSDFVKRYEESEGMLAAFDTVKKGIEKWKDDSINDLEEKKSTELRLLDDAVKSPGEMRKIRAVWLPKVTEVRPLKKDLQKNVKLLSPKSLSPFIRARSDDYSHSRSRSRRHRDIDTTSLASRSTKFSEEQSMTRSSTALSDFSDTYDYIDSGSELSFVSGASFSSQRPVADTLPLGASAYHHQHLRQGSNKASTGTSSPLPSHPLSLPVVPSNEEDTAGRQDRPKHPTPLTPSVAIDDATTVRPKISSPLAQAEAEADREQAKAEADRQRDADTANRDVSTQSSLIDTSTDATLQRPQVEELVMEEYEEVPQKDDTQRLPPPIKRNASDLKEIRSIVHPLAVPRSFSSLLFTSPAVSPIIEHPSLPLSIRQETNPLCSDVRKNDSTSENEPQQVEEPSCIYNTLATKEPGVNDEREEESREEDIVPPENEEQFADDDETYIAMEFRNHLSSSSENEDPEQLASIELQESDEPPPLLPVQSDPLYDSLDYLRFKHTSSKEVQQYENPVSIYSRPYQQLAAPYRKPTYSIPSLTTASIKGVPHQSSLPSTPPRQVVATPVNIIVTSCFAERMEEQVSLYDVCVTSNGIVIFSDSHNRCLRCLLGTHESSKRITKRFKDELEPRAIAFDSCNNLILMSTDKGLYQVSCSSHLSKMKEKRLVKDKTPLSIACSTVSDKKKTALIYITMEPTAGGDSCVYRFNSDGQFNSKICSPIFTDKNPFGIDYKNEYLVLCTLRDGCLVKMTHTGHCQWDESVDARKPGVLNQPFGVAILPTNGYIAVSECGAHRISIFSDKGKLVLQFGGKGTEPGKFDTPLGIAIRKFQELVVIDSGNNRIQIFSLSSLGLPPFSSVSQLHQDDYSPVYVW